jgi:hypothetical protein
MPEPIESAEAIANVLQDDAYLLLPDDGRRHFIGEAVLVGIAGALLTGFIAGVTATLTDRAKEWGAHATKWLLDRVETVLNAEDAVEEGSADVTEEVAKAAGAASTSNRAPDTAFVMQVVVGTLTEVGMTATAAQAISQSVCAQASLLLAQAGVQDVDLSQRRTE